MSGAFLDTTVVIHIAGQDGVNGPKGEAFVASHQPAQVPYYAFQELLTGRVRLLCDTHNALLSADNIGEAMLALLNRSPKEGRKREARQEVLAGILDQLFRQNPSGPRTAMSREGLEALALKVSRLWLRARKLPKVDSVQPLGCFNDGRITIGAARELRGPSGSFNCLPSERCAAAAYLYEDKAALTKLVDALHPEMLGKQLAEKNENRQRRKALQELVRVGPMKFDKGRCRALGDAYFAVMCPAGSVVATSNIADHRPLCEALRKKAEQP